MIDPYEMLGVARDADGDALRMAWRSAVKTAHPDSGGDADAFGRLQTAFDLLKDPVRRRIYDDTGFDPQLADPLALKGLMLIEALVNDFILDERDPGSFDPVAIMRTRLAEDIARNRFHIGQLERHRARLRQHLGRLSRRPAPDVLGAMLRARDTAIAEAMTETYAKIAAIEEAATMLEGYGYAVEVPLPAGARPVDGSAAS